MFGISMTTNSPLTLCMIVFLLPDDHSRVRLQPQDGENGSDYINANYIDVSCKHTRGHTHTQLYCRVQCVSSASFFSRVTTDQTIILLHKVGQSQH